MDLPAFGIAPEHPLVRWAQQVAHTSHMSAGAVGFATEASMFSRAGIPTVVIGRAVSIRRHKPDEYISYEQVAACEAFFARIVAQPMPVAQF